MRRYRASLFALLGIAFVAILVWPVFAVTLTTFFMSGGFSLLFAIVGLLLLLLVTMLFVLHRR